MTIDNLFSFDGFSLYCHSIIFMILAGTPAAIQLSGISCVTTLFAATIAPFPIVTLDNTHTLLHNHTLFPITTFPFENKGLSCGLI